MLQRLQVAHLAMDWQASFGHDTELNMIQWSALTRMLRELISNTIAHSQATQVAVSLSLVDDELTITVRDNGRGRDPKAWAPGLGVGGVRKRVKQLGGEVQWLEAAPTGIECRVRFARWSQAGSS
jgi:signal transduction histidine kinase